MPVTYDASFKLAVVALARIEGAFAAARMARVSLNTVKAWLEADEGVDHDEAEWDAAQKLAQSRHLQALIGGKVTGVGQWAMSAGISQRNKRMVAVQKRWDNRRAAEQEAAKPERDPVKAAVDALRDDQRQLFVEQIDLELLRVRARPDAVERSADDAERWFLAMLSDLAAMSAEDVASELAKVGAQLTALSEAQQAAERERWQAQRRQLPPSVPATPQEPPQRPVGAPQQVNRGLRVLTDDEAAEYDDQRHLWHPYDR